MATPKFTDFGLTVKKRLLDLGMTQQQLQILVHKDTGLFVDTGYMYKILTGQRTAPKIVEAICKVLDLNRMTRSDTSSID